MAMVVAENGREAVIRLADGEDLMSGLRGLAFSGGVIVAGVGMLRALRLGFWNGSSYEETRIDEPAELLAMQGNIAMSATGRVVHCHVTVAGRDGVARGGHLLVATVVNTAEIALLLVPGIRLERHPEPSGLTRLAPSAERGAGT